MKKKHQEAGQAGIGSWAKMQTKVSRCLSHTKIKYPEASRPSRTEIPDFVRKNAIDGSCFLEIAVTTMRWRNPWTQYINHRRFTKLARVSSWDAWMDAHSTVQSVVSFAANWLQLVHEDAKDDSGKGEKNVWVTF